MHLQKCNKLQPNEIIRILFLFAFNFWGHSASSAAQKTAKSSAHKTTRNSLQRDFIRKTVNRRQRRAEKTKSRETFLQNSKYSFYTQKKKYPHKSSCDLLKKIKASALEGGKMLVEERSGTSDGFREVSARFLPFRRSRQTKSFICTSFLMWISWLFWCCRKKGKVGLHGWSSERSLATKTKRNLEFTHLVYLTTKTWLKITPFAMALINWYIFLSLASAPYGHNIFHIIEN